MRTLDFKVSYENLISRIPGLFAYLETDDFNETTLHSASDSTNGCYGKIVANIKLPDDCFLVFDKKTLLEGGKTYSYRTLISYYYEYQSVVFYTNLDDQKTQDIITEEEYEELEDSEKEKYGKFFKFKDFIETGIGKKELPTENDFRYYIGYVHKQTNDILTEEEYNNLKDDEQKQRYIKKKIEYSAMPTFVYLANVRSMYDEMVKMFKICNFQKDKKEVIGEETKLCCLCKRYNEMGGDKLKNKLKEYIEEAKIIANYYKENYAVFDGDKQLSLDFSVDLVSSYKDMGIMTPYIPTWIPYKRYYKGDRVVYDNGSTEDIYICINETTGKWDEETQTVIFDEDSFEKANNAFEFFNEEGKPKKITDNLHISGNTESQLKGLRRLETYTNEKNEAETSENGTDWLFYYRKGKALNIQVINDDLGNVVDLTTGIATDDGTNLAAYGDVIENIVCDKDNYMITFTYWIGVHLIGEDHSSYMDNDSNVYHTWKSFTIDKNCKKQGIKYTETHNYLEGSDLDKLVKGNLSIGAISFDFESYINGEFDQELKYFKFEFNTEANNYYYERTIANQSINIVSILSQFDCYKYNNNEFMETVSLIDKDDDDKKLYDNSGIPMFRQDFYNGISYRPTENINVNIERGSTSCFKQHISFGEIKTLEDMENYKNGSFFKLTEN